MRCPVLTWPTPLPDCYVRYAMSGTDLAYPATRQRRAVPWTSPPSPRARPPAPAARTPSPAKAKPSSRDLSRASKL
eukprot:2610603-Rhodomonas_salina.1